MKTLIILPGWGGTKETWKNFVKLAQNDFEVRVIELPCFGAEPCPQTVWGVEEYANFVKSKVSELRTQNSELILLGHSFGGQIAAYLVANNPSIVDKLILSGPAVFRPTNSLRRLIFGLVAKIGNWVFKFPWIEKYQDSVRSFFHCLIGARDYNQASGIQKEIFKKAIRQDLTSEVSKITASTLIIWGDRDSYVSVKGAYKLHNLIKNSQLEIVKNGKHGLHLQMPQELLRIIKEFC